MAPSAENLEEALLEGTWEVYQAEGAETTINKVRRHVEAKLDLEDGFFANGDWKSKSKLFIKERVEKLLDGWVPGSKQESDPKSAIKRSSPDAESPPPKRQKRGPKSKKPAKEERELNNLSEEEKPKGRKKKPAPSRKARARKADPDESELGELSEEEKPKGRKRKAAPNRKAQAIKSDSEEPSKPEPESPQQKDIRKIESDSDKGKIKPIETDDEEENTIKKNAEAPDEAKPAAENPLDVENGVNPKSKDEEKGGEIKVVVDDEEEYSDVIDEPAPPKRKKREKKAPAKKAAGPPKAASSKKTTTIDDPQTEDMKKLQSQLTKCGIRKLWHMELRKYGDDSRAKIRHLKKMLVDAGMEGRFSEAKAREIKERRELMAEAEAAKEMNDLWGMGGEGRASRSKSKSKPSKAESEASGGEDEADEEEEETSFAARRRRARNDLAFLGDDSDS